MVPSCQDSSWTLSIFDKKSTSCCGFKRRKVNENENEEKREEKLGEGMRREEKICKESEEGERWATMKK